MDNRLSGHDGPPGAGNIGFEIPLQGVVVLPLGGEAEGQRGANDSDRDSDVIRINRSSPIPLYYQIQQHFIELIHTGKLVPGDKLPPEETTAEEFGVSRYTVRQAFQSLERDGLAEQLRGRGFFVKEPRIALSVAWLLTGFSEHMSRLGHSVTTEIISTGVIECPLSTAEQLEIRTDDEILFVKRLRRVDSHPMIFDLISIPTALAPGIQGMRLGQRSLLRVLKDDHGLEVVRESRELHIMRLQRSIAEAFDVAPRTPAFVTEGVGYGADRTPIYYSRTFINEALSHFRFDMILEGDLEFAPASMSEPIRVERVGVHPDLKTRGP